MIFSLVFFVSDVVLQCPVTDGNMASGGLRDSSLSTIAKLNAGHKASIIYFPSPFDILRVVGRFSILLNN